MELISLHASFEFEFEFEFEFCWSLGNVVFIAYENCGYDNNSGPSLENFLFDYFHGCCFIVVFII